MLTSWTLLAASWKNQYTDTGWFGVVFTLVICAFILVNIYRASTAHKQGRELFIRRIPGLNAIDEAVGRATEMGRPVLMVPGINNLVTGAPVIAQALGIFRQVTRISAKFANPILLCCADAAVYTLAQETIRDVYQTEGVPERFDPDSVRFISDRQFAFASGVAGLILREKVAAAFLMGDFFAESLIFAENANAIGAIQVASSTQMTQTPFFVAACDYVLIGDEFYAASAYLTREKVLVGSLLGQDWAKMSLIFMFIFGVIITTLQTGLFTPAQTSVEKKDSQWTQLAKPRDVLSTDTFVSHLFHPQADPTLSSSIVRDTEAPQANGSAN